LPRFVFVARSIVHGRIRAPMSSPRVGCAAIITRGLREISRARTNFVCSRREISWQGFLRGCLNMELCDHFLCDWRWLSDSRNRTEKGGLWCSAGSYFSDGKSLSCHRAFVLLECRRAFFRSIHREQSHDVVSPDKHDLRIIFRKPVIVSANSR